MLWKHKLRWHEEGVINKWFEPKFEGYDFADFQWNVENNRQKLNYTVTDRLQIGLVKNDAENNDIWKIKNLLLFLCQTCIMLGNYGQIIFDLMLGKSIRLLCLVHRRNRF